MDCKRQVMFSDNVYIILEPENLAEDLYQARKSDYYQRQADKDRMKRMLTPILSPNHRRNFYQKYFVKYA